MSKAVGEGLLAFQELSQGITQLEFAAACVALGGLGCWVVWGLFKLGRGT